MSSRRGSICRILLLCAGVFAILGMTAMPAKAQLIAYWHFNDSDLTVDLGTGTLTHNFVPDNVQFFSGSTINAQGGAPAGSALALQGGTGLVNNGKSIFIAVDTTGQANIKMSFASQRTGTGFNGNQVAYSSNGGMDWTDFGDPYALPLSFGLITFDFSAVSALNNNPDVQIRITFFNATGATGNNRIDNLYIEGQGDPNGECCLEFGVCNLLTETACDNAGGTWSVGGSCSPNPCPQPTGACCNPVNGVCTPDQTEADCNTNGGIYKGHDSECDPNPCIGACCDAGGATCTIRTPQECVNQEGSGLYRGDATVCEEVDCPPDYEGILINEIRIDQPGTDVDEYFELVNTSGTMKNLDGLAYIVIGDTGADRSGRIEVLVRLDGYSIPAGGHFLVAEASLTFPVTPDIVTDLNFENSDNVTHMLVSGFHGNLLDDVDTENDCLIDNPLWLQILDLVALTESDNLPEGEPPGTGCHYGTGSPLIDTLRDGPFVPGHVYRLPDGATGFFAWKVGGFNPEQSDDTPGATNMLSTGACCAGSGGCLEGVYTRQECVEVQSGQWLGRDTTCETHGAQCVGACCICTDPPDCTMFNCMVTDQVTCDFQGPEGGVYQGGLTVCPPGMDPPVPPEVDCAQCLTIDAVRALPPGTPVRICNVVLSSNTNLINSPTNKSFQIQDGSGGDGQSGLTVFGTSDLIDTQFAGTNEGDQIDLQGTTGVFNGLIQLQNGQPKALALSRNDSPPSPGIPAAVVVTSADFQEDSPTAEGYESEIVRLECVLFLETGNFAAATNYTVTDGNGLVVVRITTGQQLDIIGQPIPTTPVSITGIHSQFDGSFPFTGGYQLQPRTWADFDLSPECGPTAACCLAGPTCQVQTELLCNGLGGIWQGEGTPTCDPLPECPDNVDTRITEIRIDQPGDDNDEYFELSGTPGVPLGDLTYIVIGESNADGSGVIEAVVSLQAAKVPADGYFLCTEPTFTLRPSVDVDLMVPNGVLNFENDDNVTHMLVKGFTGAIDQDLDTNDDGVLDVEPWSVVLDKVALIRQQNPPTSTEWHYGPPTVGPVGGTSPGHVALCPSSPPEWRVEGFDPAFGDDTPGEANPPICGCAGCLGDMDGDGFLNALDVQNFAAALLSPNPDGCADINQDAMVDLDDILPFVDRIIEAPACGLPRAFGTRIVTWNLLNYNGGAPSGRLNAYRRVMNHLNADVIVAQEVQQLGSAQHFLDNVLNASNGPGGYVLGDFIDGPNTDNALFYRTDKIEETGDHITLATSPRWTDRWQLRLVENQIGQVFYLYASHFKADSGDEVQDEADRAAAAALIRADTDALPVDTQFMLVGDLNLKDNGEQAWLELVSVNPGSGLFIDPLGPAASGNWNNNCLFSAIHTQSTHNDNAGAPGGAAGGGLDDRFDFMLVSDALLDGQYLRYQNSSYQAFGNDGNHCNADINDPPVIPEGVYIADALHTASDHLPVYLEIFYIPPPEE